MKLITLLFLTVGGSTAEETFIIAELPDKALAIKNAKQAGAELCQAQHSLSLDTN